MSDITKCTNKLCTLKERCYRFTSVPNEHRQSYAEFSQDDEGDCEYFIQNKENMKYYIEYSVTETRTVELKREPTKEEIDLINHKTEGSMYDTPDDLIDWETEDVIDANHHWVQLKTKR